MTGALPRSPRRPRSRAPARGLGWAELLLCAAVVAACWTRTPVGTLARAAVALARGGEVPDLLASYGTSLPAGLDLAVRHLDSARQPARGAWTAGLRTAIAARLGAEALPQVEALRIADPEAALETWAVGAEQRARAVARARASGAAYPERYASHRRYLPAAAMEEAARAVDQVLALATAMDLSWPVPAEAPVTSPFGWRPHPVLGTRRFHEGVDIAVPEGTAVMAASGGRVARAGEDAVNGRYVVLDHGHGVTTAYCHGSRLHVARGDAVARQARVMESGSTGRSTGPHLHFGLRIDGRPTDPEPFRQAAARPPQAV